MSRGHPLALICGEGQLEEKIGGDSSSWPRVVISMLSPFGIVHLKWFAGSFPNLHKNLTKSREVITLNGVKVVRNKLGPSEG